MSPSVATALPEERLRAALAAPYAGDRIAAYVGADVEAVLRTGSTNGDLLGRLRFETPVRPILRAAVEQTAGRGRHGRAWHAVPGSALLFSLAIPFLASRVITGAV